MRVRFLIIPHIIRYTTSRSLYSYENDLKICIKSLSLTAEYGRDGGT